MARFERDSYNGTHYKLRPLGWRRIFPSGWVFPYFVPSKIRFSIRITRLSGVNPPPLNQLDIYEVLPNKEPRLLTRNKSLNYHERFCKFDNESFSEEGEIKYVLGEPNTANYFPLVVAKVYSTDDVWLRILLPIIAGGLGIVLGWLLDNFFDIYVNINNLIESVR